ncbi:hypothetical protein DBV15_04914 [Temnothorax longispinosus]|uniref:Uncharacterized protein n=1 Tax=Temnothorax longispinosus TaxID=300112 RepID=A0A4V3SBP0_9HYME|nr:hypothetical protein DBV15_04914 [Temnothorax longispinosus]
MMPDHDEIRTSKMPIYASAIVVREIIAASAINVGESFIIASSNVFSFSNNGPLLKIGRRCRRRLRGYELSRT